MIKSTHIPKPKKPMEAPRAIELNSSMVKLIPLREDHIEQFYQAGKADSLWRWVQPHQCTDLETTRAWVTQALVSMERGEQVVFAIIDVASGEFVGSTRYCSIDIDNGGIEIGFTFIAPQYQRSHINTHAKYLLLRHAFETLGAIRVQFKTHESNQKSRNAIARLGATFEGVIRHQRILANGERRNTAQFSITDDDWPQAKQCLNDKMAGGLELVPEPELLGERAQQLIANTPMAQLMIASADNLIDQIIHLPLIYDAETNTLRGHLFKGNKLSWLLDNSPKVTLVFAGEDGYVSPLWHKQQQVPTWNYQNLHLNGRFSFVADGDSATKLALLAQQVDVFEGGEWQVSEQPELLMEKMSEQIRCFEIAIDEYQLVEKLSDNRSQSLRDAIAKGLTAQGKLHLAALHG